LYDTNVDEDDVYAEETLTLNKAFEKHILPLMSYDEESSNDSVSGSSNSSNIQSQQQSGALTLALHAREAWQSLQPQQQQQYSMIDEALKLHKTTLPVDQKQQLFDAIIKGGPSGRGYN
jgi:hypothetical protein